jgi:uncharacterized protein (DUF427 family)
MVQAIWNGIVIAESEDTKVVEGNHYFPPSALKREYFHSGQNKTVCPWKGVASYYDVEVDGKVNKSAAWYYSDPSAAASQIKDYVAFWNGVKVVNTDQASNGVAGRLRTIFS